MLISIAALCGCSSPSSSPAAGNPSSDPTVISLPTQLPDEISHTLAMALFNYDHSRPFEVQERSVTTRSGALVHDISYLGIAGKRSQAYLVTPIGKGKFGAVMCLHSAFSSSSEFLDEACDLANRGVASLLITPPEMDPQPATDSAAINEIVHEMRDMQRSLDLLAAQPSVDPHRLGFVGFSFGAVRGATFAGLESGRLRVAILMSTPPSYDASHGFVRPDRMGSPRCPGVALHSAGEAGHVVYGRRRRIPHSRR
jgi:pimeloyl-ACP methyl ester carboxylesterase